MNEYNNNQPGYNSQPGYSQNQPGYNPSQPGYSQNQPGYSPNQQYYPQPSQQQQYQDPSAWPHMKLKDWLLTQLVLLVPILNIVLIFKWAFGKDVNPSKKTYFQASLIWTAIAIVLMILMMIFAFSLIASLVNGFATSSSYYYRY